MLRVWTLLIQMAMIAVAVVLADYFQATVDFIPKAIISLPEVDYTPADFCVVLSYFLLTHLICLSASQIIYGRWIPENPGRTANELYTIGMGFSLSALLIFTTTSVSFDPNFIVGIAVFSVLTYLLVGMLYIAFLKANIFSYLALLLNSVFRKAFTVQGILIIAFALSPGVLAKLFVSNRDVANTITQIRIYFTGSDDAQYRFITAFKERTFSQPMLVKQSPIDPSRIYILEREGRLVSISYPGGEDYKVELNIRNKVGTAEIENGALGFALSPKNGSNLQVYLYYTAVSQDGQVNRLSRFDLGATTLEAVSDSELPLMSLTRENSGFHNGGSVEFGPDGFLYVALGEGVHPKGITSQTETLRGGILRIDVNCREADKSFSIPRQPRGGETGNYCIPLDNPFVDNGAVLPEYWALGLRNPFRISFDGTSGQLWAGDVGSTKWEEVNRIEKGRNYQFPWIEGNEATEIAKPDMVTGEERGPVYTYVHTAYDRAVIGGGIYRGNQFPELNGKYLFADNYSSKLFSMTLDASAPVVEHIATADQFAQRGTSSVNLLSNGDILVTTLGRSAVATGEVLRLQVADSKAEAENAGEGPEKTSLASYSPEEIHGIYVANCARCHGMTGKGDGPDSPSLQVALPDFSSVEFQNSRTDEQLYAVTAKGGYAVGKSPMMPPWGEILNEEEISGLISWIRSL